MDESRKLATIMAIDVAGYSRAMEADDAAAAGQIAELRETVRSIIAPIGGRVFNTAGDSVMVEFPAASSGVQAAMSLLAESKAGVRRLPKVRIGMHLGEVIIAEGGDLLGHGVNVAARLQALAEPGTAVVSEAVRVQVRSAAELPFTPQGRVQLDKMSERIAIYALSAGRGRVLGRILHRRFARLGALAFTLVVAAGLAYGAWRIWRPPAHGPATLVVLPFDAASREETAQAFAENFTSDLHDTLSRSGPGLEFIGRATTLALRGKRPSPNELAALGITHALDGVVAHEGERVVVTVELLETRTGRQIWRDRLAADLRDMQTLQTQLASRTRDALQVAHSEAVQARQIDPRALELYYSARYRTYAYSASQRAAAEALEQAVAIDPNFARAWYRLADVNDYLRIFSDTPQERERAYERGKVAAERYLALASQDAEAWATAAAFAERGSRLRRAAAIDPNHPLVIEFNLMRLNGNGQGAKALALADRARVLDPLNSNIIEHRILALLMGERLERAEAAVHDAPTHIAVRRWPLVIMAWLLLDENARAAAALDVYAAALEAVRRDQSEQALDEAAIGEAGNAFQDMQDLVSTVSNSDRTAQERLSRRFSERSAKAATENLEQRGYAYMIDLPAIALLSGADAAYEAWGRRLAALQAPAPDNPSPARDSEIIIWSFVSPLACFRLLHRDPRFWSYSLRLTAWSPEDLANAELWPPDFCRQPGFPYDCTRVARAAFAEAQRAQPVH